MIVKYFDIKLFNVNNNCSFTRSAAVEKIKIIQENNAVKKFTLFTSAEAYGVKAEYIRNGMDYEIWLERIEDMRNANLPKDWDGIYRATSK